MSIVIPLGVDTAETSYLEMAAGSEYVSLGHTFPYAVDIESIAGANFYYGTAIRIFVA